MNTLQMVILAKSYKPGGRCIAGKLVELLDNKSANIGPWVRLVSNDKTGHGSINEEIYKYEDGQEARVLDIVEIPILGRVSVEGQPENIVIDESKRWHKLSSLDAKSISCITDNTDNIWLETGVQNNVVTALYDQKGLVTQSLFLIKPSNLFITLSNEYDNFKVKYKKKTKANFDYANVCYKNLSVTCPAVRKIFNHKYPSEGGQPITLKLIKGDDYFLCLSLGPRFGVNNYHHKLVATIFDFDGYLQKNYIA